MFKSKQKLSIIRVLLKIIFYNAIITQNNMQMYVENYLKEKSRKEKVKNKIMILKAF